MNGMEKLIEQKICQEIDVLAMQLISVIDDNEEKLKAYGEQGKRIVYNALFELLVNAYRPASKTPLTQQHYARYAEQARKKFKSLVEFLEAYKPEKLYK